jgi:hypothetical protein
MSFDSNFDSDIEFDLDRDIVHEDDVDAIPVFAYGADDPCIDVDVVFLDTKQCKAVVLCSIPKIQILNFSQTRFKFKMNFKFHFKMFVCELISTNKV